MLTAIYAARNICGADYDLWDVNLDGDYHEEIRPTRSADRFVPQTIQFDPLALLQSASPATTPMLWGVLCPLCLH